jgi:hypothetical protein
MSGDGGCASRRSGSCPSRGRWLVSADMAPDHGHGNVRREISLVVSADMVEVREAPGRVHQRGRRSLRPRVGVRTRGQLVSVDQAPRAIRCPWRSDAVYVRQRRFASADRAAPRHRHTPAPWRYARRAGVRRRHVRGPLVSADMARCATWAEVHFPCPLLAYVHKSLPWRSGAGSEVGQHGGNR